MRRLDKQPGRLTVLILATLVALLIGGLLFMTALSFYLSITHAVSL